MRGFQQVNHLGRNLARVSAGQYRLIHFEGDRTPLSNFLLEIASLEFLAVFENCFLRVVAHRFFAFFAAALLLRTFALAAAAIRATSLRCSGVIFSIRPAALFLPPRLPSRTAIGSFAIAVAYPLRNTCAKFNLRHDTLVLLC